MRRTLSLPLAALTAVALVLSPVLVGTSAAASSASHGATGSAAATKPAVKPAKPATKSAKPAAKPAAKSAKPAAKPKASKAKRKVVVVGVVSDTRTVTTSGTSTVLITVRVQGGDKEYRGKAVTIAVDKSTVVKRNHGKRSRYELRTGDKVTVHARRAANGALTASYVAASGRHAKPVASPKPATSTATTR